ncbi:hypothetical protein V9K92_05290 [Phyllobacterium sp. CCNWLW109]|uniref:hypothetical protein n=1 Tax=Phyllobacterium sp. CCNWLW109 TaxID=3127479 RepID=UPI0030775574
MKSVVDKDQVTKLILLWVGTALHNWSRVEGSVINVLWRCMGAPSPQPASIVWSNIVNLNTKLRIVEQIVPLKIADAEAIKLWSKISEKIISASKSRNKLAHFEIVHFENGPRLVPKYQSADMGDMARADTTPENVIDRYLLNFEE